MFQNFRMLQFPQDALMWVLIYDSQALEIPKPWSPPSASLILPLALATMQLSPSMTHGRRKLGFTAPLRPCSSQVNEGRALLTVAGLFYRKGWHDSHNGESRAPMWSDVGLIKQQAFHVHCRSHVSSGMAVSNTYGTANFNFQCCKTPLSTPQILRLERKRVAVFML